MQGGNMDGLWEAPPPGLRMLGDMHMARVLASGLCSPGLHPSSALDVAQPACPCGGTGRSLPTRGSKDAAARARLARCPQRAGTVDAHGARCRPREPISRAASCWRQLRARTVACWRPACSVAACSAPPLAQRMAEAEARHFRHALSVRARALAAPLSALRLAQLRARRGLAAGTLLGLRWRLPPACPGDCTITVDAKRVEVHLARQLRRLPDTSACGAAETHPPVPVFRGRRLGKRRVARHFTPKSRF